MKPSWDGDAHREPALLPRLPQPGLEAEGVWAIPKLQLRLRRHLRLRLPLRVRALRRLRPPRRRYRPLRLECYSGKGGLEKSCSDPRISITCALERRGATTRRACRLGCS